MADEFLEEREPIRAYGRVIEVFTGTPDEFGQFTVALVVDGKTRWTASFSRKDE